MKQNYLLSRIIIFLFAAMCCNSPFAWAQQEDFGEKVIEGFTRYYDRGIDEKLYLQTDKPYYSAGEKIWFKGFLINAITHEKLDFSNYIYVELIDSDKELVSRVKVKRNDTGFDGYLTIDPELGEGDYQIRAYTKWMTNNHEDFFFHKNINIISPIPPEADDTEIGMRLTKANREAAKIKRDFDVQFFPESGSLVAGLNQVVAFKAVGSDGLKVDVEGTLYNSSDEAIGEIKSSYKGMGTINIISSVDQSYYAMLKTVDGEPKRFDLPEVLAQGAALKVSRMGTKIYYQAQASSPQILEGSNIIIQSRGRILTCQSAEGSQVRYVTTNQLYDGISVVSLVSSEGRVLAERIVFKKPEAVPSLDIISGAQNYSHRQNTSFRVDVKDSEGNPAKGDFAISVTDNSSVRLNESSENIVSYLLLSSEIRGYIEEAGDYFINDDAESNRNLDMLMLTQGWRRFDTQQLLDSQIPARKYAYEASPNIEGVVKGFFGNEAKNPRLSIFCQKLGIIDMHVLDSTTKFNLTDLDIPDSTVYILQAQGRRGGNSLDLTIKPEVFPSMPEQIVGGSVIKKYVPQAFVAQSQDKFVYEGGMKTIEMEAVSVSAPTSTHPYLSGVQASRNKSRADLENMSSQSIITVIQSFPGMTATDSGVNYRSSHTPVRFLVDGFEEEFDYISMLYADDIEHIDFFSGAEAAMFSNASGGIFSITLREGVVGGTSTEKLNIARVAQLGYQEPMEFYQPSYDNPSVRLNSPPDYRTTIYWNGQATTNDKGTLYFNFFTADKATEYTVTVEGITEEGELCKAATTIKRTLSN